MMNDYNIDSINKLIISQLQEKIKMGCNYKISNHDAWDFSVCQLIAKYKEAKGQNIFQEPLFKKDSLDNVKSLFVDACWYLALQGIIRPSTITPTYIGGTHGADGMNFSITESGKQWLKDNTGEYFIFTTAIQYTEIIKPFANNFGDAFMVRSKEAASCYQSCNYYATCAMSGAATESVILSIGTRILGSIEKVKESYYKARGRKELLNKVKHNVSKELQNEIDNHIGMLNYWRDESSHGSNNNITKFEALNSLDRLLNFSRLVHTKWDYFKKPETS